MVVTKPLKFTSDTASNSAYSSTCGWKWTKGIDKNTLELNNVTIDCSKNRDSINTLSVPDKTEIVNANGTINTVIASDCFYYSEAITCSGDLNICGIGTLNVGGVIKISNNITISGGNIIAVVNSDYSPCVVCDGNLEITLGKLSANSGDTGIKAKDIIIAEKTIIRGASTRNVALGEASICKFGDNSIVRLGADGSGATARYVTLYVEPSITATPNTVGTDDTAIYVETATVKSYTADFDRFTSSTDKAVVWCDSTGATNNAKVAGTSLTINDTAITFTTSPDANAGEYYFKVSAMDAGTGEMIYSAPIKYTITKKSKTNDIVNIDDSVSEGGAMNKTINLTDLIEDGGKATGATVYNNSFITDVCITDDSMLTYTAAPSTSGTIVTMNINVEDCINYNDYVIAVKIISTAKNPVTISGVTVNGLTDGTRIYDTLASSYSTENMTVTSGGEAAPLTLDDLTFTWQGKGADGNYTNIAGNEAPTNAGDYRLLVAVKSDNTDYTGSTNVDFTIGKATIIVTADSKSAVQGESLPAYTASYKGFVGNDSKAAVIATDAALTSTAADTSTVGTYTITPANAAFNAGYDQNYQFSYVNGTLSVNSSGISSVDDGNKGVTPPTKKDNVANNKKDVVKDNGVTDDVADGDVDDENVTDNDIEDNDISDEDIKDDDSSDDGISNDKSDNEVTDVDSTDSEGRIPVGIWIVGILLIILLLFAAAGIIIKKSRK